MMYDVYNQESEWRHVISTDAFSNHRDGYYHETVEDFECDFELGWNEQSYLS